MVNHTVYITDESGADTKTMLAEISVASQEGVDIVLSKPMEGEDNRSPWVWVRLQNGDLILGTYPQGDTYFEIENIVSDDSI